MKLRNSFLLLSTLFCMFMTACQKEVNVDDNFVPTPTTDSNYLDKIYDIYDDGSGVDTQNISVCRYDNLKRLTAINDSVYNSDKITFTYYYNSTDTLPYKSMYTDEFTAGSDTEIVYHYYNTNQQKIKDSIIKSYYSNGLGSQAVSVQVVNYSYAPGKMFGELVKTGINSASAPVYSRDTAILDANNNIISSVDYTLSGSTYVLNRTSGFTYDNHPNPFSRLNIFKSYNRFPNGETLFWEIMCYNNILTQYEETLPPNPYIFDPVFTLTYKQNGFPASNSTGSGATLDTEAYTYKSL